MRHRRLETAPRFLKCPDLERPLTRKREIVDQAPVVSERSRLEQMVRDVSGMRAAATRIGIEPLDGVGHIRMQPLLARRRDTRKQRLPDKFVAESERPLGTLRARDDDSHLLRFFDHGEKLVNIDLADRCQQLKTEAAPDYCGRSQHALFILVEPCQAAPDDQPYVFRNVNFVDRNVSAELASGVKHLPFLDQMPVQLFDEKRISL